MSTVHICLNDIVGVAVACEVIFYPGDTPFFSGSALAVSGARSIRLDADGNGSVTLLPGRYAVRFSGLTSNTDTLLILVPNEEGRDYQLSELVCGGNWILPFRDFLQKSRNLGDVADPELAFAAIKQSATAESTGVVGLATQAEVDEGTDASKCVTPATLANAARVKLLTVADDAGRFALTPTQVRQFDEVMQLDTRALYQVIDVSALSQEWGYVQIGTRPEIWGGLTSGLVAYWRMDEVSGTRFDATGNGHDLTDNNNVGGAQDGVDTVARFVGTSEYLSVDFGSSQDVFTVSLWTKGGSPTQSEERVPLVHFWEQGNNLSLYSTPEGFLAMWGGIETGLGTHPVVDGEWHHVVFRSVTGYSVDGFVDGVLDFQASWNPSHESGNTYFGSSDIGHPAAGFLKQVGFWNRALSDAEIVSLYTNGIAVPNQS